MPDLAFRDQLLDRARDVFHRHGRVDAVLIEQVDMVGPQALQRTLDYLADMRRPAIEPDHLALLVDLEAELRANENPIANRLQRLADELLVDERSVALRGVEKGDATIDGGADYGDRLFFVGGGAKAEAQAHAAQPDRRNLQVTVSKFSFLHFEVLSLRSDELKRRVSPVLSMQHAPSRASHALLPDLL